MHALSPHLRGYGLTTAIILCRIPDFKRILQTYVWQDYDTEPEFPKLRAFLDFWDRKLDGPLFSVKITHARLVSPDDLRSGVH
jgi:uncharacterized protein Usg